MPLLVSAGPGTEGLGVDVFEPSIGGWSRRARFEDNVHSEVLRTEIAPVTMDDV